MNVLPQILLVLNTLTVLNYMSELDVFLHILPSDLNQNMKLRMELISTSLVWLLEVLCLLLNGERAHGT